MKYIKKYENLVDEIPPNFKKGDTVVCINPTNYLRRNNKYTVKKIFIHREQYFCYLNEIKDVDYYCSRFISEIEYNSKKYNI